VADFSDLNPAFASRLAQLRDALNQQGIGNSLVSGYRSPEYQNQMYQNHLAQAARRPLPYPNVEAPSVVAAPWRSFHNYGLAADFNLTNPNDYARLQSMAPQYGLSGIGMSDKGHIQLGGDLASDINQYHLANWRPASQPAPASGAIAYTGPTAAPSRVGTATPGQSNPFTVPANAPMGMRNNNPLNIKWYKDAPYEGLVGPSANTDQGDPQMVFKTPEAGWNAAYSLLNKKYGSGMTTPNMIIAGQGGWTPGNKQAALNVAKNAGIGPDDDIGFSDPAKAQKFMRALVQQEQGGASSAYPDAMIKGAVYGTTMNAAGAPTTPAGGPAAPAATPVAGTTLPGFQPGSPANKMAQDALKKLGGGGDAGDEQPQAPPLQMAQSQAMGGPMMMRPGGQNIEGRMQAAQNLAQQGYMMQPSLAALTPGGQQPVVPSSGVASQMPGGATGMPSLLGTTLNSPSQLQMALMSGSLSPYDMYARQAGGFGST